MRGWMIAVSILGFSAQGLASQVQPIRDGGRYPAGTRVLAAAPGVSFTVPTGFNAEMDPEAGLFLLVGADVRLAVWAYSAGSPEDVADVMVGDLEDLGLTLTADEIAESTRDRLSGTFDVLSPEGVGRLYGSVIQSPGGNAIGVAALGARGSDTRLRDVTTAVLNSVEWSVPEADAWTAEVSGTVLTNDSSSVNNVFNIEGDHGAGATEGHVRITLCTDGTYSFESEWARYYTTSVASVSGENSDAHSGEWSLVAGIQGDAWLILEPLDRDEILYEADFVDGVATLGGRGYDVSRGPC